MTLDNVEFTEYPIHVMPQQGHGTVWVNMDLDIVAKLVTHLDLPNGGHHDSVRQLTSLDLNSPVENSQMTVPAGFRVQNDTPTGCLSSAVK